MDDRILEAAIGKVLRNPLTASPVELLWHAGEPFAVGIDLYRSVSSQSQVTPSVPKVSDERGDHRQRLVLILLL